MSALTVLLFLEALVYSALVELKFRCMFKTSKTITASTQPIIICIIENNTYNFHTV